MSSNTVTIRTGTKEVENYLTIVAPTLSLDTSGTSVIQDVSKTYLYSVNGEYVQVIYSFNLLAALLDSAPTNGNGGPTIFQMNMYIPKNDSGNYLVDAQIQTKGNSAMSPTYVTQVTKTTPLGDDPTGGVVYFPVTNFFTVSAPGAPYTITVTLTKTIA
jgi:hypothetical protein